MRTKPGSAGGGGPAAQRSGRLRAPFTGLKMPCPTSEWALGSAESRDVSGWTVEGCVPLGLLLGRFSAGRRAGRRPQRRDVGMCRSPSPDPGSSCSWHLPGPAREPCCLCCHARGLSRTRSERVVLDAGTTGPRPPA